MRSRLLLLAVLFPLLAFSQPAASIFSRGLTLLNAHRWQDALDALNQAPPGGAGQDGLLYWKAFALAQLNRKTEALAVLAQLPGANAWRQEADALETALRGDFLPEPEEAESLQALANAANDPDRLLQLVQRLLAEPHTLSVKNVAQAYLQRTPAGRAFLRQIALGNRNPDLQRAAVNSLSRSEPQALVEIYPALADNKRQIIFLALAGIRDKRRMEQLIQGEQLAQVRLAGYQVLISQAGGASEATSLLAAEPLAFVRQNVGSLIDSTRQANARAIAGFRSPDPQVRQQAVNKLMASGEADAGAAIQAAYAVETDRDLKNSFVLALFTLHEFDKARALALAEKDFVAKRFILQRLVMDDEGVKTIR